MDGDGTGLNCGGMEGCAGSLAKPKGKRRNSEKRKERSRDAARCRRSREAEIFSDMLEILPLSKDDISLLDKASVIRVAITYLRIRDIMKWFPRSNAHQSPNINGKHLDRLLKDINLYATAAKAPTSIDSFILGMLREALDGFVIILANDGNVLFVTDHITDFLGIQKLDIIGQSIWEYAHQCDHSELQEIFHIKCRHNIKAAGNNAQRSLKHGCDGGEERFVNTHYRDLFVRLKCTLTSRGRNINIKSASYKVIHLSGHIMETSNGYNCLIGVCRPIPHPNNVEMPLDGSAFLTKHSLDLKFTYVDDKMCNLLGYTSEELLDTSVFQYHHAKDSDELLTAFRNLINKGQMETYRYRFLGKYGGYCWLVTHATIIYDKCKPQGVVCINYAISNLVNDNEIYASEQYESTLSINSDKNRVANSSINKKVQNINTNDSDGDSDVILFERQANPYHLSVPYQLKDHSQRVNELNTASSSSASTAKTTLPPLSPSSNTTTNLETTTSSTTTARHCNDTCVQPQRERACKETNGVKEQHHPFRVVTKESQQPAPPPLAIDARVYNGNDSDSIRVEQNKLIARAESGPGGDHQDNKNIDCGQPSSKLVNDVKLEREESKVNHFLDSLEETRRIKTEILKTTTTTTNNNNNNNNNNKREIEEQRKHVIPITSATADTDSVSSSNYPEFKETNHSCNNERLPVISLASALDDALSIEEEIVAISESLGLKAKGLDEKGPKTVTLSILKPNNLSNVNNNPSDVLTFNNSSSFDEDPFYENTLNLNLIHGRQQQQTSSRNLLNPLESQIATFETVSIPQQLEEISSDGNMVNRGFLPFPDYESELSMFKDTNLSTVAAGGSDGYVDVGLDDTTVASLFGGMLTITPLYSNLMSDELIMNFDTINNDTNHGKLTNNFSELNAEDQQPSSCLGDVMLDITSPTFCNTSEAESDTGPILNNAMLTQQNQTVNDNIDTTTTTTTIENIDDDDVMMNNGIQVCHSQISDPFISYGDESNDTNVSQHLLSPTFTEINSIENRSPLPLLYSPNCQNSKTQRQHQLQQQIQHGLEGGDMELTCTTENVDDLEDLTMRAPYIPMDEHDDLPLLTSDDQLIWCNSSGGTIHSEILGGSGYSTLKPTTNPLKESPTTFSLYNDSQQQQQEQYDFLTNQLTSLPAKSPAINLSSPFQMPVISSTFDGNNLTINLEEVANYQGPQKQNTPDSTNFIELLANEQQKQKQQLMNSNRGETNSNLAFNTFLDSMGDLFVHDERKDDQLVYSWEEYMAKIPLDESGMNGNATGNAVINCRVSELQQQQQQQLIKLSVLKVSQEPLSSPSPSLSSSSSSSYSGTSSNQELFIDSSLKDDRGERRQVSVVDRQEVNVKTLPNAMETVLLPTLPPQPTLHRHPPAQQSNKRHCNNSTPHQQIEPKRLRSNNVLPPTIVPTISYREEYPNGSNIGIVNTLPSTGHKNAGVAMTTAQRNGGPMRKNNGKWTLRRNEERKSHPHQPDSHNTNSVLKNLLISGCDLNAGYCIMPIGGGGGGGVATAANCSKSTTSGRA